MGDRLKHFLRYQFPALLWAVIIFIASSIPASKLPKFTNYVDDKVIHISIFLVFGLLVYRALEPHLKTDRFNWGRLLLSISAVIVYGISDEIHQGFVPGRTVDVLDATADSIGGILSATLIYLLFRLKARKLTASS